MDRYYINKTSFGHVVNAVIIVFKIHVHCHRLLIIINRPA